MAVVELAEPCRCTKLKRTMAARLDLGSPTRERVIAHRNDHAGRDFKGRKHRFAMRVPVELEAIARFETHVDGSHEVFPCFQNPTRIGNSEILILKEFLADPAKRSLF